MAIFTLLTRQWFVSILVLIVLMWTGMFILDLTGSEGVTVSTRSGASATIDFGREHDRLVARLGPDNGLLIHNPKTPPFRAVVVELGPAPPVLCWVCGDHVETRSIMDATHRSGDWFFRAPLESLPAGAATYAEAWRDKTRTIAWNRVTGERVMLTLEASADEQRQALESRGLSGGSTGTLTPASLGELEPVSMLREGCVIVHSAFAVATGGWVVIAGGIWGLLGLIRRRTSTRA